MMSDRDKLCPDPGYVRELMFRRVMRSLNERVNAARIQAPPMER